MYKIFALFILIIAPVLVTLASNFAPSTGDRNLSTPSPPATELQPSSQQSAVHTETIAPVVAPQPVFDSAATMGQPMLDPTGIEPTPQLETAPAAEVSSEAVDAPSESTVEGQH